MDIFLYFLLGSITLMTVHLARSRGQKPWLWGLASILLMMIPGIPLISIVPMVFLLLFKKPSPAAPSEQEERVICPKCHAYHASGHNFCVNCGWQLDQPYAPEAQTRDTGANSNVSTADNPNAGSAPGYPESSPEKEPVFVSSTDTAPVEEAVAEQSKPVTASPPSLARFQLSAAGLTEKGISLFTQGRIQEAVDQFTKAIALDPDYTPAWAKRAEAYVSLGLCQKAEEDKRRLEGS